LRHFPLNPIISFFLHLEFLTAQEVMLPCQGSICLFPFSAPKSIRAASVASMKTSLYFWYKRWLLFSGKILMPPDFFKSFYVDLKKSSQLGAPPFGEVVLFRMEYFSPHGRRDFLEGRSLVLVFPPLGKEGIPPPSPKIKRPP